MRSTKVIHAVSCHAEGEVGDVIVGGVGPLPGETLWEKSRFIAGDETLRNFMLNEPRGGVFRHVNLLVPPVNPAADVGWIIMEPCDTPPMSGSNSMCVSTVLLETGILPMVEPVTELVLEAPGGLVHVTAHCRDGKVTQAQVQNVPSFVHKLDVAVEVEGLGTVTVDTAYGGDSYAIVDARALGFEVAPHEAGEIAATGVRITNAVNEQVGFEHPTLPGWKHVSFCQMAAPVTETEDGARTGRSAVVIQPGKIDRSPCGTGCSARMSVLHARGELAVGETYIGRSIIGSTFHCSIREETDAGGTPGIVPIIAGQAWITGTHQHMLDATDPWPGGYRISDTWPGADMVMT